MENENYRWPISRDFPLAGHISSRRRQQRMPSGRTMRTFPGPLEPDHPLRLGVPLGFPLANHRKVMEAQMMKEFVYISQTKNIMLISFDVNVHSLRTSAGIPALVPFRPWWWWTGVPSLAFSPRWSRGCTPRCRARLIHCDFLMWKDVYLKKGEVG